RFPGQQAEGIEVLDVTGKRVWHGEGLFIDRAGLDLEGLPGGVYFVKVQFGEVAAVRRVVLR
ncbi:MAG: T9SS type A sorting domain-containing protein, partial [Phaeodactylibacter sp.]|nr:T9SS type A sorting domain-containing protein [Phaeodactylibacter sp.]